MIKRLIAKIMGWELVWLVDFDSETNLRFAKPTAVGWRAYRLGCEIRPVILLPNGQLKGGTWVKSWVEEYPNPGNIEV
jgi:hypothetical protein